MTRRELKELLITWLATRDNWICDIPEVEFEILRPYGPKKRKLKAKWGPELAQDLNNWHSPGWYERYTQNLVKVQDYLDND